jgi:ferredoxin-thioredoxin reductase catalytic chain
MAQMSSADYTPTQEEMQALLVRLKSDAEQSGYHINPDASFVLLLLNGLLVNEKRYGYLSCPCRLSSGILAEDLDIICPCDYRDADLGDFEACYCSLYVSDQIARGEKEAMPIPERRLPSEVRLAPLVDTKKSIQESVLYSHTALSFPVWRCKVCGYLCARDNPPEVCPICKVKKDRFEKFI